MAGFNSLLKHSNPFVHRALQSADPVLRLPAQAGVATSNLAKRVLGTNVSKIRNQIDVTKALAKAQPGNKGLASRVKRLEQSHLKHQLQTNRTRMAIGGTAAAAYGGKKVLDNLQDPYSNIDSNLGYY